MEIMKLKCCDTCIHHTKYHNNKEFQCSGHILEGLSCSDWEPAAFIDIMHYATFEIPIKEKEKKEEKEMVPKEKKNLAWKDAWYWMLSGKKIKRPQWKGYWSWENGTIMMYCRDGSVTDIRETPMPAYTFSNIAQRDWMVVEDDT